MRLEDILYETKDYFVLKVSGGVEVYKMEVTHSVRCAQIYLGERSLEIGIAECNKRQELIK